MLQPDDANVVEPARVTLSVDQNGGSPIAVSTQPQQSNGSFAGGGLRRRSSVNPPVGSGSFVGSPLKPQNVRDLITEVKPYSENIQALSTDANGRLAFLTNLYQQSNIDMHGSFAGPIPLPAPPMPPKHHYAILDVMALIAHKIGHSEAWGLIRKLSPTPLTDFSEAFRLIYGSNICVFPYLVSLGGTVGAFFGCLPVMYLLDACVELQCDAKDVAVNVVLKQLVAEHRLQFFSGVFAGSTSTSPSASSPMMSPSCMSDSGKTSEQRLKELEDVAARHITVNSYFHLAEILWTYPTDTKPQGTNDEQMLTTIASAQDVSAPPTSSNVTYAELPAATPQQQSIDGGQKEEGDGKGVSGDGSRATEGTPSSASSLAPPPDVEIRSCFPSMVRWIVTFGQFMSSCCYGILIANTMNPLFEGMSQRTATILSCMALTITLCALTPNTLAIYATVNNVGLLGSTFILIIATLFHEGETTASTTTDDQIWIFFRTPTDAFMFFPTLLAYISPALFAIDVETNIARRCLHRAAAKLAASFDVGSSSASTPAASPGAVASPVLKREEQLTHSSGVLLRRFHLVSALSFILSMVILIIFGEFIFANFKSRTNPVAPLCLGPCTMRTLLLCSLTISLLACASLNSVGLPNILDDLNVAQRFGMSNLIPRPLERILLRMAIMIVVLLTLFVLPYFDLVASLVGCLGVNGFSLFLPVLFKLQAIRRRDQSPLSTQPISWWSAFRRVESLRMQLTMVVMVSIGTVVLVTGVGSCVSQLIARLSATQTTT
jgi:hypothetical protein